MKDSPKAAGLIYGPELHYLDHMAPLCSLLEIPLLVTEESIYETALEFYPNLKVQYHDYLQMPSLVVKEFEVIFHCSVRAFFDEVFFFQQKLLNKKVHTIWCPHGNSDKGHQSIFMEALAEEKYALVYGPKMIHFLKEKGVLGKLSMYVEIGNFRNNFYKKHRSFYQTLLKEKIVKRLHVRKKNILYAPTWNDHEHSSSVKDMLPILVENLPENYNLIVQLHPNLKLQDPLILEKILLNYEEKSQVLFLENFPAIYPLIHFVDLYIGDASSIGYDFITCNKPMFLLNQNHRNAQNDPGLYLFRCGVEIKKEQYVDIYKIISAFLPADTSHFSQVRKEVTQYTFGKEDQCDNIKERIEKIYQTLPDKDLNFF